MENFTNKELANKAVRSFLEHSEDDYVSFLRAGVRDDLRKQMKTLMAQRLIECRKEKKYTQKDIADYLGMSPPGVASWEQGVCQPSIDHLYLLAKLYKKSMEYMCGEEK